MQYTVVNAKERMHVTGVNNFLLAGAEFVCILCIFVIFKEVLSGGGVIIES